MTIRVDHSADSGTYVVVCDADPWRHLTDSLAAAHAAGVAHEELAHPGVRQFRGLIQARRRRAERQAVPA